MWVLKPLPMALAQIQRQVQILVDARNTEDLGDFLKDNIRN